MEEIKPLVERARKGDTEAFGELVVRFSPGVRAHCLMHAPDPGGADDLAQQVFLTAWNRLPTLKDDELFWPWLKSIGRNILTNEWRRITRERNFKRGYTVNWLAERGVEGMASDEPPEWSAARVERLRDCIESLPEHFRRIVRLYYDEKKTSAEIGRELQRSSDAVRQALVTLREKLRQCIERKLSERGLTR